jgi:hypothetical protein
MSVDIFKYRNWVLEAERSQTQSLYKNANVWGAESCGCGTCLHFISLRSEIYPNEVRNLFEKLGIDINKEVEVCDFGDGETEYIFSWWFHFIGDIVEGGDCEVPLAEGGFTRELSEIDDVLSIGFTRNISLPFVKEQQGLIQIELMTTVPRYTIGKN